MCLLDACPCLLVAPMQPMHHALAPYVQVCALLHSGRRVSGMCSQVHLPARPRLSFRVTPACLPASHVSTRQQAPSCPWLPRSPPASLCCARGKKWQPWITRRRQGGAACGPCLSAGSLPRTAAAAGHWPLRWAAVLDDAAKMGWHPRRLPVCVHPILRKPSRVAMHIRTGAQSLPA